ncbi:hypothetical protein C8Q78DRAFT_1010635 [Trametes maxima]|nr:hypothetical protein C8Q78DRAFT_1010635 [Trametes maxima]
MNRPSSRLTTLVGGTANPTSATPHPRPSGNESGLSWKPSAKPWVKLRYDINNDFKAGQIVQIYDVCEIPASPTDHGTQPKLWTRSDSDTLYRFRKRYRKRMYSTESSPETTQAVIRHTNLVPVKGSSAYEGEEYTVGDTSRVLFLTQPTTVRVAWLDNKPVLQVPKDTGVTIQSLTSITGGRGGVLPTQNPVRKYYIVNYYIRTETWHYMPCTRGLMHTAFEAISSEKQREIAHIKTLAPPMVVSAEKLTSAQRASRNAIELIEEVY